MKINRSLVKRNVAGIVFVTLALILLVFGLAAQAQELRDDDRGRPVSDRTVYDSQFLGGLWAAHDGPESRQRNFFPFYYEAGEGRSATWSSPLILSSGRTKADGSEEIRIFGGLIQHSIDRSGR